MRFVTVPSCHQSDLRSLNALLNLERRKSLTVDECQQVRAIVSRSTSPRQTIQQLATNLDLPYKQVSDIAANRQ